MTIKTESVKNNFQWMDIAKGIGISLVVIGHFNPESSPNYWVAINEFIYSFHMPLFFIMSGYLYNHGKYSYRDLMENKTKRLLYPFVTIAILFFLIKLIAGKLVNLDHPVDISHLSILLTHPIQSYMPLLWFVHALFLIFAVYPLLRRFVNSLVILLFFVGLTAIIGSDYPVFGKAFANMPFFIIGVMLRENAKLATIAVGATWRYITVSLLLFLLSYAIKISFTISPMYDNLLMFFIGALGSVFIINISHSLSNYGNKRINDILLLIGYCSMTVYLFHTLFESMVKIAFIQVFKDIQIPFELIAFSAIICGIIFPIIMEKFLLRRYWFTRKFILGID